MRTLRSFSGHLLCKKLPLGIERPHRSFDVGLDSIEKSTRCAVPSMHFTFPSICAKLTYKKPRAYLWILYECKLDAYRHLYAAI